MDELGNILREAREARGLTLAQAQDKTRINARFLEALETGHYELLPTAVHVRGYLGNYARFLELDPRPLLERYELTQQRRATTFGFGYDQPSAHQPIRPRDEQPFFVPVDVDLENRRGDSDSVMRLVIIVALLMALGLVANRFLPLLRGQGDGTQALTSSLTEVVSGILNQDHATPTAAASDLPLVLAEPIIPTGTNNTAALPTMTPTRRPLPAIVDTIQLRLEITERTWIRVIVDGDIVFEGQAVRGDGPFEWNAQQELRFLTGNAAGIFVTINGTELGKLGGRGEIVDEIWRTSN
jgi:transcriptional regulator with XRE-family HTH domain